MAQRVYKHLSARDRHMIFVLRKQRLSLSEIARRIGKDKSTVSRELRRNATRITAQDRFYFRVDNCWNEEQLDHYLDAHPEEDRRVRIVWRHHEAQLCAQCVGVAHV